jgi:hypothetical protein
MKNKSRQALHSNAEPRRNNAGQRWHEEQVPYRADESAVGLLRD